MGLSREARIITLLVIDVLFFFVELISGYAVGSIALIADSYHMLNDVISLFVALYAIRLATASATSRLSFGWQRAEVLGALINGVFLLALCFSIFLECLQRLYEPPEVSNPMIIIIVGSFGLLSNIVGLFLFHDHGHGGGGHSHSHSSPAPVKASSHSHATPEETTPLRNSADVGRPRNDSIQSLYGHPAQVRAAVVAQAEEMGYGHHAHAEHSHSHSHPERSQSPIGKGRNHSRHKSGDADKLQPLVEREDHEHSGHSHSSPSYGATSDAHSPAEAEGHGHSHANGAEHSGDDDHSHSKGSGGGGHSHGSMNMQGVFLHVLGDALGNVGVIASGLIILLCEGNWRFYADPAISFAITCIIFSSALPLVKSASYILLQATPNSISLDDLRDSIKEIHGVVSVHELHCWQLSESKIVASVHVLVERGKDYMATVLEIRKVLHEYGIHSSTIQPEFGDASEADEDAEDNCLIKCPPGGGEDCEANQCCPPGTATPVVGEENV